MYLYVYVSQFCLRVIAHWLVPLMASLCFFDKSVLSSHMRILQRNRPTSFASFL